MGKGFDTIAALIDRDLLAGYTHRQAMVLIVLAHHEHADAGAYPSERRLATMAHVNRRTVRAALDLAISRGLIVRDHTEGRNVAVYRFGTATGAPRLHQSDTTTGAVHAPRLVQSGHATGALRLARNGTRENQKNQGTPDAREPWQIERDELRERKQHTHDLATRTEPTPDDLARLARLEAKQRTA